MVKISSLAILTSSGSPIILMWGSEIHVRICFKKSQSIQPMHVYMLECSDNQCFLKIMAILSFRLKSLAFNHNMPLYSFE